MLYKSYYNSPLGKITLLSDEKNLRGLWIEGQKHYLGKASEKDIIIKDDAKLILKTKKWLDRYFQGENPNINELSLNPIGGSDFSKRVWKILCKIPYGKTITYSDIANTIAKERNISKMSAQAVGGAVAHNPISIIIPCHRVVGKDGSLTGYAGGINKKIKLLEHEGVNIDNMYVTKK